MLFHTPRFSGPELVEFVYEVACRPIWDASRWFQTDLRQRPPDPLPLHGTTADARARLMRFVRGTTPLTEHVENLLQGQVFTHWKAL